MDIDFDHTGVRRDVQNPDAGIERRRIAFQPHGAGECGGDALDRGYQSDEVLSAQQRWEKYVDTPVPHFHSERGAHHGAARFGLQFARHAGGQRIERETITDRGITRYQKETLAPQGPR